MFAKGDLTDAASGRIVSFESATDVALMVGNACTVLHMYLVDCKGAELMFLGTKPATSGIASETLLALNTTHQMETDLHVLA